MNVSLTPELEKMVDDRVGTGLYSSASEVVREALRRQAIREAKREDLRAALHAALEDEANGRVSLLDGEAIKREGRRLLAEKRAAACHT